MARAELPDELIDAYALGGGNLVAANPAALRGDDDDAVGGLRSVDRRRRRALEHLDVVDVVRIDVCKAVRAVLLASVQRAGQGGLSAGTHGVGDDHAVDDVQRIDASEQRRSAANLYLATAAGGAVVHADLSANDLTLHRAFERWGGHSGQLLGTHVHRGRGRIATLDRGGRAGHCHAFELKDVLIHREIGGLGRGGNATLLSLVAQRSRQQLHIAAIDAHAVFAALVGARTDSLADDRDCRVLQRRTTRCDGDASRHLA